MPVPVLVAGTVRGLAEYPAAALMERVPPPPSAAVARPFGPLPPGRTAHDAWRDPAALATPTPSPEVLRALVHAAHARRGKGTLKGDLEAADWEVNDYVRLAYVWDWAHTCRWFGRLRTGQHVLPVLPDDTYSMAKKGVAPLPGTGGAAVRVDLRSFGSFVAHVVRRRLGIRDATTMELEVRATSPTPQHPPLKRLRGNFPMRGIFPSGPGRGLASLRARAREADDTRDDPPSRGGKPSIRAALNTSAPVSHRCTMRGASEAGGQAGRRAELVARARARGRPKTPGTVRRRAAVDRATGPP